MATTTITLTGTTNYNPRFPPRDAKKGYVAKITGRATGPVKYAREFLGETVTLVEGDEGLYERQIGEKKGGFTRYYHVVMNHPEHGLIASVDCESEVPKISKLLSEGHAIKDIVEIRDLRPSTKHEGRMVFNAEARSSAVAKQAARSTTLESAIASCWDILVLLPQVDQRKVLTELRRRVNPPAGAGEAAKE